MIERRARWEKVLACTHEQLVLEIISSLVLIAGGVLLRPRLSSALIVLFGLAVGLVTYGCNRLVLAQPFLARRVDWESEPHLPSTPRRYTAGLLGVLLIALAIGAVYESTRDAREIFFVSLSGMFLAYALITAAQRFYLKRGFARLVSER